MEIEEFQLQRMLTDCAEMAVQRFAQKQGLVKMFISQSQAYKLYGEGWIKKMLTEKRITREKQGMNTSGVKYKISELEAAYTAYKQKRTVLINN
jgi:hypothetical protein